LRIDEGWKRRSASPFSLSFEVAQADVEGCEECADEVCDEVEGGIEIAAYACLGGDGGCQGLDDFVKCADAEAGHNEDERKGGKAAEVLFEQRAEQAEHCQGGCAEAPYMNKLVVSQDGVGFREGQQDYIVEACIVYVQSAAGHVQDGPYRQADEGGIGVVDFQEAYGYEDEEEDNDGDVNDELIVAVNEEGAAEGKNGDDVYGEQREVQFFQGCFIPCGWDVELGHSATVLFLGYGILCRRSRQAAAGRVILGFQ